MGTISFDIHTTTNDAIIKFTTNKILVGDNHQFNNIDEAKNSPLAQQLFHLPFVKRILISANFIAIERFSIVEWTDVQEEVKEQLEHFLNSGGVLFSETDKQEKLAFEIYAELTPNPSVMKFVANKILTNHDLEYKNNEATQHAPLATALFNFPFVKEVFISENYVSVTKNDSVEWNDITVEIRSFIKQFLAEGNKIVTKNSTKKDPSPTQITNNEKDLDEVSRQIIGILDEYIRPAVAADGGNILFQSYDENSKIVNVILQGACSGCPSSTITLKNGIENMLKQLIPGKINEVVALNY